MVRRFLVLLLIAAALSACETPVETLKATAYSEIVRAQMAAGDEAGARQTVKLALQAIDEDEGDDIRTFTIAAAAVAQVRAGDLAGADETVWRVNNPQKRGFVLSVVALALNEAGQKTTARMNAGLASVSAETLQPGKEGDRGLALVAWVVARSGDVAGARQVAERIADADIRAEAAALIARTQAEAGDATGAEATLNTITVPGLSGGGMEGFMIARAMAVDVFDVFDDFFLTADRSMQHSAWHATARAFAKSGDMAGTRRAFDKAINTADAVAKPGQRLKLLAATALAQAEAGDRKAALATLDYARAVARRAEGSENAVSGQALLMLEAVRLAISGKADVASDGIEFPIQTAIFRIRLGDLNGASASLDRLRKRHAGIKDRSLLVAGLGRLAVAYVEAGDRVAAHTRAAQAQEIAQGIPKTDDDRAIAMFFAAVALARTGNIEEALAAAAEIQESEKPAK